MGAFAAVVLGAILFKKWERRIEMEKEFKAKREWLHKNLQYAIVAQKAARASLAEIASEAYFPVALALGDTRVPDKLLRRDVTRLPREDTDTVARFITSIQDLRRMSSVGPLATADKQASRMFKGIIASKVDELSDRREQEGLPAISLPEQWRPTADQLKTVADTYTPEVTARLGRLTNTLLAVTPDVLDSREFEQRQLRIPAIEIAIAVQEITSVVSRADVSTDELRREFAGDVSRQLSRLLSSISDMRNELWESAKALIRETEAIGGVAAASSALARVDSAFLDYFNDESWEIWLKQHKFD